MSGAALHAVVVDRDPTLLSRLTTELLQCGYATETLASTLGLTPDLLDLSSPNLMVVDAELPGLDQAALLVIVRSVKSRRETRVVVTTSGEPDALSRIAADAVVRRQTLVAEGAAALGLKTVEEKPLDLRALLDEVLGPQARGGVATALNVRVDLFSKSNLYVIPREQRVSGVFFATSVMLPLGQRVQLSLDLLGRTKIETMGEVLWQRPHSSFGGRMPTGVGIKLPELTEADREAIGRLVEVREPLVFTG